MSIDINLTNVASGTGTANGTNTGDETTSTIKTKLGTASGSTDGYLLQADWNTFNSKQPALGFTPENVANKQTDLTASATKYPTVNAINAGLALKTPMPFTMLAQGYNEFAIAASVVARAGGTFSNGNPITWSILNNSDNHGSSFFRHVFADGTTKRLKIAFPTVKAVLSFIITGDETISLFGATMAASVGVNFADITTAINHSGYTFLIGAGTTTWTKLGGTSSQVTAGTFSTTDGYTLITFGSGFSNTENAAISVSYQGANNYRIERSFSGGASNTAIRFRMIDIATNTPVLTAPTASDYISITGVGKYRLSINMSEFSTAVLTKNEFLLGNNFWCSGLFELWMKAVAISTTEILVKWQAKSGVTSYTLKRSTAYTIDVNGDYVLTTPTTIYTGTDLQFIDTSLTTGTMYYYQLLDQASVEISQFNEKTK